MKYLAVDSDIEFANRAAAVWKQKGIEMDRVNNMTEAITKLVNGDYLYVGMNGDVVNFMPLLRTMSTMTSIAILIGTGHFDTQTEVDAMHNGADLYARWHDTDEENVASVLAHIEKKSQQRITLQKVVINGSVILSPFLRTVFVKDRSVELTPLEFELLHYFMLNHGIALSYKLIYHKVWESEYDDGADEVVKSTVKRLRKKIDNEDAHPSMIENLWGYGFRCRSSFSI